MNIIRLAGCCCFKTNWNPVRFFYFFISRGHETIHYSGIWESCHIFCVFIKLIYDFKGKTTKDSDVAIDEKEFVKAIVRACKAKGKNEQPLSSSRKKIYQKLALLQVC